MSYEDKDYQKRINLENFIVSGVLDSNLIGPTLPSIPPFTCPSILTGSNRNCTN
ncbi:exosporium leader peptide-containing protein [Bacillus thuringiensis]|uniref:exosporium leader peptide-containing protein n=1 Tax=Bacillus thuringiensis TaxID=1428 RepID=UPI000E4F433F